MKLNSDIFAQLVSITRRKAPVVNRPLINPNREWMIGLLGASFLFLGGASYLGYDFYTQYESIDMMPAIETQTTVYREKDVALILKEYNERENRFNALHANRSNVFVPAPIEDPSRDADTNLPSSSETTTVPLAEEGAEQ